MIRFIKLYGATDGTSGDLTVTSDVVALGVLNSVEWIDGTFADGVDAVLTMVRDDDASDITLLTLTDANIDKIYSPRYLVQGNDGANIATTYGKHFVNGKLKLVVADGGDTKSGGCIVYYEA